MALLRALQRRPPGEDRGLGVDPGLGADKGLSVLVVTHDAEIAAFADRCLKLRDGRLVT
jgi:hypothetical protein